MARDPKKYLYDMQSAVDLLVQFTDNISFDAYQKEPLMRSAVERQLGIIGEVLAQLAKIDPPTVAQTPHCRTIIAFHNIFFTGTPTWTGGWSGACSKADSRRCVMHRKPCRATARCALHQHPRCQGASASITRVGITNTAPRNEQLPPVQRER